MLNPATEQRNISRPQVLSKAVVNAATALGLPQVKLARILGVSTATASRLHSRNYQLSPQKKEWDFGVLLVRLFRSLDSVVGGSAEDARAWLDSPNRAFSGKRPADLIETTEGLVRVVGYLDACRGIV